MNHPDTSFSFPLLSAEQARQRMNALTAADTPFLFIFEATGEHALVIALSDIDPEEILYAFPTHTNASSICIPARPLLWRPHWESEADYARRFTMVRSALLRGDSYLANLTLRIPLECNLTLRELFLRSRAAYRLMLRGEFVCFSPEPFVRIEHREISTYPMKGTIDATLPHAEARLMSDEKEKAEHATVTDLLRNDLSRVATNVRVKRYRYAERIETCRGPIISTSSEISGTLEDRYFRRPGDVITSMLPAGSVTGAPKRRTIEILRSAEGCSRGFYTGVAGIYSGGVTDSCVLIRFIEQSEGRLFFRAGGGITARSDCKREYSEVMEKTYVPLD